MSNDAPETTTQTTTPTEVVMHLNEVLERLRELGELRDPLAGVPMVDLTDEQLADRIRQVDEELAKLSNSPDEDLRRQFAMLDYLIANPSATIPPLWSLPGTNGLWDERVAKLRNDG